MKAGNNMRISRVQNMTGSNGNKVANQFILNIGADRIFQSYDNVIAVQNWDGVTLDKNYWDYSVTTGKYRNQFLGETKAETLKKIKSGEYKLADLNKE